LLFNVFLFSWNYNYLPLTEGWFALAGKFINQGYLPYIDFYAYLTPFYYWYSYFIVSLSENILFTSRILGQINLNILFFLTYKVLNINFPKSQSIISALFALIFYLSINAIISYDFIHIANIFALLSFYIISQKKSKLSLIFGGFFAAMCFLTKQSNGAVIFLTLSFIFIFKFWDNKELFIYPILGSLIATIINFFPFLNIDGLNAVYQNIVINAGSAKGGILHSLTTLVPPRSDFYSFDKLGIFFMKILLPLVVLLKFHKLFERRIENIFIFKINEFNILSKNLLAFFLMLSVAVILIFTFKINDIKILSEISGWFWNKAYLWSGYCPIFFLLFLKNKVFDKNLGIFLLGLTFAAATSAGLTPVSIFLHVGFLICILLSFKSFYNISTILGFIIIFSVSTTSVLDKREKIYHWWGINSYKGSLESHSIPAIKNIKTNGLSEELEIINKKIQNCTISPKNLIAFPHGALLNLTTNINPPTRTISYWFDFLSNKDATIEFHKLGKIDLDIIGIINVKDEAWDVHKMLFRPKEKYLAQEKIAKYLNYLVENENYSLLHSFYVDDIQVNLYSRPSLLCN
jgi:hypothetical protein